MQRTTIEFDEQRGCWEQRMDKIWKKRREWSINHWSRDQMAKGSMIRSDCGEGRKKYRKALTTIVMKLDAIWAIHLFEQIIRQTNRQCKGATKKMKSTTNVEDRHSRTIYKGMGPFQKNDSIHFNISIHHT